jgi:hypothetical protein
MHFDFYVGDGIYDFEAELRNRIKTREDWYDIFLVLKRG